MSFKKLVPILRIFDEVKAKEFYIDFLEFTVDWEHRFDADAPIYMQVSKGACVIHLSEHSGDSTPGVSVRLETTELDEYLRHVSSKTYKYARPGPTPRKTPWGTRELTIQDPFGNKLVFTNTA